MFSKTKERTQAREASTLHPWGKTYVVDRRVFGAVEATLNERYEQGYDLVAAIPRPETMTKGFGDTYIFRHRDA